MHRLLPLVLVAAGCLSSVSAPNDPAPATDAETAPAFAWGYRCPGASGSVSSSPCALELGSVEETHQEPALAIAPDDPRSWAIATIAGELSGALRNEVKTTRITVWTTRDGGRTWDHVRVPALGAGVMDGDPSIAIDAQGAIHVAWMSGSEIAYSRTQPGGTVFAPATTLSRGGGFDREWLSVGPDGTLNVAWQRPSDRTYVVKSADGGASWEDVVEIPACVTPSPVAYTETSAWLTCTTFDGSADVSVRLYRVENDPRLVAEIPVHLRFSRVEVCGGSLIVAGSNAMSGRVEGYWTPDGGVSWIPLEMPLFSDGARQALYALSCGPDGSVHLLARSTEAQQIAGPVSRESVGGTYHVVWDADGRRVVKTVMAAPVALDAGVRSPLRWSDDFGGATMTPESVVLAWAENGAISVTESTPIAS